MSTTAATATVEVPCDPDTAFEIFTRDIGTWWKRGTYYWNDADRGLEYRFEPAVGGRLVEVYDLATGEGFEIGRVLVWEPGEEAFEASAERIFAAVADDPFDQWLELPPDVFHLTQA